mgnify:FL=1
MNHDINEWRSESHTGFVSNDMLITLAYTSIIIIGLLAIVYTH